MHYTLCQVNIKTIADALRKASRCSNISVARSVGLDHVDGLNQVLGLQLTRHLKVSTRLESET
jgi:hypothetical protein